MLIDNPRYELELWQYAIHLQLLFRGLYFSLSILRTISKDVLIYDKVKEYFLMFPSDYLPKLGDLSNIVLMHITF